MPGLFYLITLTKTDVSGFEARVRYPSKHPYPVPIGTYLRMLDLDEDRAFMYYVVGYEDDYVGGNLYMLVGTTPDAEEDPKIECTDPESCVTWLKKEGWEECLWP
jgi:hypothetical protein